MTSPAHRALGTGIRFRNGCFLLVVEHEELASCYVPHSFPSEGALRFQRNEDLPATRASRQRPATRASRQRGPPGNEGIPATRAWK